MEIYCKTCDKVLGNYPDEKIPPNVKGHTTCKSCGSRIEIFRPLKGAATPKTSSDKGSKIIQTLLFNDAVKSHPLLSYKKDRGAKKEDFMALALGLLILFAITFIYKPDFDPSKFSPGKLQAEIMTEMMNNPQQQGEELPEGLPDMKQLEKAMKELEEMERRTSH